jgi:hypothetical protein
MTDLEQALSCLGNVVFVGAPAYPVPWILSDSLVVDTADEHWKECFRDVAQRSRAIIMWPELTQGVREELSELRANGWAGKLIVLMPPLVRGGPSQHDDGGRRARWKLVAEGLQAEGLSLPAYSSTGCFFTVDEQWRTRDVFPLAVGLVSSAKLCAVLEKVLPTLEPAGEPTAEFVSRLALLEARSRPRPAA